MFSEMTPRRWLFRMSFCKEDSRHEPASPGRLPDGRFLHFRLWGLRRLRAAGQRSDRVGRHSRHGVVSLLAKRHGGQPGWRRHHPPGDPTPGNRGDSIGWRASGGTPERPGRGDQYAGFNNPGPLACSGVVAPNGALTGGPVSAVSAWTPTPCVDEVPAFLVSVMGAPNGGAALPQSAVAMVEYDTIACPEVPEPGSLVLFGSALAALVVQVRRHRQ